MTNDTSNEAAILAYVNETFADIHVVSSEGNSFIFFGPAEGADNKFPFATLVTNDDYDQASNLTRPGVFRLNIGVGKATFLELFGEKVPRAGADGIIESGFDYAALDRLMPHPVYGNMFWVCVLNPGAATFERVKPLLAEAYNAASEK